MQAISYTASNNSTPKFIFLATLPTVFKEKYAFSTSTVGLVYTGLMAGFAAGVALSATVMDRLAMRRSEREGSGGHKPENRLVPIVYASPLIPAGLLLYGWSLQAGLHFVVPIVGSALVGAGMVLTLVCFFFFLLPPPHTPPPPARRCSLLLPCIPPHTLHTLHPCTALCRWVLDEVRLTRPASCPSTPTSSTPSRPSRRPPSPRRRCCAMCSGPSCLSSAPRSMIAWGWGLRTRCWPVYHVSSSPLLCSS